MGLYPSLIFWRGGGGGAPLCLDRPPPPSILPYAKSLFRCDSMRCRASVPASKGGGEVPCLLRDRGAGGPPLTFLSGGRRVPYPLSYFGVGVVRAGYPLSSGIVGKGELPHPYQDWSPPPGPGCPITRSTASPRASNRTGGRLGSGNFSARLLRKIFVRF